MPLLHGQRPLVIGHYLGRRYHRRRLCCHHALRRWDLRRRRPIAPFCAAPMPNQKRGLPIDRYLASSTKPGAPSSARLCSGLMPMVATVIATRRAPSPEIGARDTPLDGAANGSAGVNSTPDVDARVNSAPDLGGQRCGNHEDRGDSTGNRQLAEHLSLLGPNPPSIAGGADRPQSVQGVPHAY
jgi:hypothetical protein